MISTGPCHFLTNSLKSKSKILISGYSKNSENKKHTTHLKK